jgi:uncharacterized protein YodC (DUF2158 family)
MIWRRAMPEQLKAGDKVQLKSGGPIMTIETIGKFGMGSQHDSAKCVWFEKTKLMSGVFEFETLAKV